MPVSGPGEHLFRPGGGDLRGHPARPGESPGESIKNERLPACDGKKCLSACTHIVPENMMGSDMRPMAEMREVDRRSGRGRVAVPERSRRASHYRSRSSPRLTKKRSHPMGWLLFLWLKNAILTK